MAKDKKGFILYADLIKVVSKLPDEIAGKLFKIILRYVNDLEINIDDLLLDIAFEPIKNQLKRDLLKFEDVKGERSKSGQLGNLKRYNIDLYNKVKANKITLEEAQNLAKDYKGVVSVAKLAVNDTVTVTVTDTVNVSTNVDVSKEYTQQQFLKRWKDARQHFDKMPTNISKLQSWELINFNNIKKTYSGEQIEQAIQGLFQQSTFPATRLRPSHFLELEHFEKYLTCFDTKEVLFGKAFNNRLDRL